MTKLRMLLLSGNPLVSDGLVHLQELPSLTTLYLTGTNVDDDAVIALKKKLPKASILDVLGEEVRLETPPPPRSRQDLSKSPADFKLTPDELTKDHENGGNAFKDKYSGKVIEVTGEVAWLGSQGLVHPTQIQW